MQNAYYANKNKTDLGIKDGTRSGYLHINKLLIISFLLIRRIKLKMSVTCLSLHKIKVHK